LKINWNKLELIANHHDVYLDEYEGDLLPIIDNNKISAVNLAPVFCDDSGIFSTDIPLWLNLDIPTSKHLPTAKTTLIKHYKEVFPQIAGINFTNNFANLYDFNLENCKEEISNITNVCKKLGIKNRYCIYGSRFGSYEDIQTLFTTLESEGVDQVLYMNNSKLLSPEDALLEAIEASYNLSIPVSFAGRLPSMLVLQKTPQLKSFVVPPSHIRELLADQSMA